MTCVYVGVRERFASCFALLVGVSWSLLTQIAFSETGDALAMIYPAKLKPGAMIMFVAPAGVLDREKVLLAKGRLEERGYQVTMRDDIFSDEGYLAGSDERRAAELMQAFLDPEVDAVFAGRGGYGTMRILDMLDYRAIRENPKLFTGFSDNTALHAALNCRAGLVTYHSPHPTSIGCGEDFSEFSARYFFRAVEGNDTRNRDSGSYLVETPPHVPQPKPLGSGKARGRLCGGNLSLISALEGTPYAIDTQDAILLVEDVREAPYRVDRMLRQLKLAGKLDHLRGAVVGQFTRSFEREDTRSDDPRYTMEGVLRQYFEPLGIPVLLNFPVGHHKENCTLPLGGEVEIDADAGTLRVFKAPGTEGQSSP